MGNFEGKMMIKHQPREVPYSQTNPYCMRERGRERGREREREGEGEREREGVGEEGGGGGGEGALHKTEGRAMLVGFMEALPGQSIVSKCCE